MNWEYYKFPDGVHAPKDLHLLIEHHYYPEYIERGDLRIEVEVDSENPVLVRLQLEKPQPRMQQTTKMMSSYTHILSIYCTANIIQFDSAPYKGSFPIGSIRHRYIPVGSGEDKGSLDISHS